MGIEGYTTIAEPEDGLFSTVYRAVRAGDGKPVILRVFKNVPGVQAIKKIYAEDYRTSLSLDLEEVVRPECIEDIGNATVLVCEDFGGESLKKLMESGAVPTEEALAIAVKTAAALGKIHGRNVVHKHVKPSNIIYNRQTGQLKLTGLGLSTTLKKEMPARVNPGLTKTSMHYVSPEQTGRINRLVDYRTDYYSLGAVLYELFTGSPPFGGLTSSADKHIVDYGQLIHSHIARQPVPPCEVNASIPVPLSDIILKLLFKSPEDRYQSARCIEKDLEWCLACIRSKTPMENFTPGKFDVPERFTIPEKLYGRDCELGILMECFLTATEGLKAMCLVSGHSGVGKSALVREISKPIALRNGNFLSGKFDRLNRNVAYGAIVQAFRPMVRQMLSENEINLETWKRRLLSVLGQGGGIITELIDEVKLVIGQQPPIPKLGPVEAQNRFNMVFLNFLRVFSSADHPLVLFLDDLQWADSGSEALIELIMADGDFSHLLIICAYRDNEVDALHPLLNAGMITAPLRRRGSNCRECWFPRRPFPLKTHGFMMSCTGNRRKSES
ncbi:MAG: AAA family ATPase [Nitrospirae bacterium]|nr:AAA family ATPase [Nitrospirota bacterium]